MERKRWIMMLEMRTKYDSLLFSMVATPEVWVDASKLRRSFLAAWAKLQKNEHVRIK